MKNINKTGKLETKTTTFVLSSEKIRNGNTQTWKIREICYTEKLAILQYLVLYPVLELFSYLPGSPVWGAAQGVWPPFLRCGLRRSQGMHAAGSLCQGNSPPPSTNHDHDEDGPHASEGMSPSTRRSPLYLNDADQHFIALTRCWHRPSYFFSWEYLLLLYNSMHTFYWDVFPYHLFSQLTANGLYLKNACMMPITSLLFLSACTHFIDICFLTMFSLDLQLMGNIWKTHTWHW